MPTIQRVSDKPYRWKIAPHPLSEIANHEKAMPKAFIRKDGFGITKACRTYLEPLIRGEAPPPYGRDGLPAFVRPSLPLLPKKLAAWSK
jgi:6-phosphofructokinase 1